MEKYVIHCTHSYNPEIILIDDDSLSTISEDESGFSIYKHIPGTGE